MTQEPYRYYILQYNWIMLTYFIMHLSQIVQDIGKFIEVKYLLNCLCWS